MVNHDLGNIEPIEIQKEMSSSYLDYAMSVIVSRALPDVRDGLKPVQRRILYAMYDQGMRPNSSYKKSARLVGEVLGKYHPHGDSAVYEAQVRMAQPFSFRYPLVDGQGNFGSIDGDSAAAMRYTECKLSPITEMILTDIDRETVDWSDNFDQSLKEPKVLPSRLPVLLVNGASGIAVGMATNIPPHNLSEICDGIIQLIKDPNSTVDRLMSHIKGPDFPTGAHIWGQEGIRNAYNTGRGRVIVQATHKVEDVPRQERKRIVFTEIPFQMNKSVLVTKIADLIKTRKIEGISEIRDESDRKGMRIVLELRRSAHVPVVLNNLYKLTPLRSSFSFNMIALVDGTPKVLNLKQALNYYIGFRVEVVRRRAEFDLKKNKARLHVLEGLRIAIDNLDKAIELIRASVDVETAREALMQEFSLSEIQAQAILDMQLRRLAALEREKIENEYKELLEEIKELEELLSDNQKVLLEVSNETKALKKKYGDERRTVIHEEELGEWRREDTEPRMDVIVTISKNGYVKRVPMDTYKKQNRGGKGVKGQRMTKDDDIAHHLLSGNTHDYILFFTDKGKVFATRVFELSPDQSRNSRGTPVQNLGFNMEPNEQVQAVEIVSSYLEDTYLFMTTKKGQVKRMHLPLLRNMNRSGLKCFNLKSDDALVSARLVSNKEDVIIVTRNGLSIRFPSSSITPRQRAAGGMRGIRLNPKDQVVALTVVNEEDGFLFTVSQQGRGKFTSLQDYRQQQKGGKGLITQKVTEGAKGTGKIVDATVISKELRNEGYIDKRKKYTDEEIKEIKDSSTGRLACVTEKAQVLRVPTGQIRETGRNAQGVNVVKPNSGDRVSAITMLPEGPRTAAEKVDLSSMDNDTNNSIEDTLDNNVITSTNEE